MKSLSDWKKYLHKQTIAFISQDLGVSIGAACSELSTKIDEVLQEDLHREKTLEYLRGTFNVLLNMSDIEDEKTWKFILTFEDLYLLVLEEMNILPRKGTTVKLQRTLSSTKRNSPFDHRETTPEISTILPSHLYLSSSKGAANAKTLKELNIRYIINCAAELINVHPNDFAYTNLNLRDDKMESILDTFEESFAIIEKARSENCGVLVHCYAGISRSSAIVIAYLMKVQNLRLNAAWALTQCRRPIIAPNESYSKQLTQYETTLYPQLDSLS